MKEFSKKRFGNTVMVKSDIKRFLIPVLLMCIVVNLMLNTKITSIFTHFHEVNETVNQTNKTRTSISNIYTHFHGVNETVYQTNKTRTSISNIYTHFHEAISTVNKTVDREARKQTHVCGPISNFITKKINLHSNIRESICNCCFQHNFNYLMNNRNICKTIGPYQDIDLFIMIFTQHINFKVRQAIRQTWLTASKNNTANVRYAFLLGKVSSVELSKIIAQENDLYKDILKEDFIDTYENQTLKTIMGFKWIVNYCRAAENVLKTDDDTFINVPNVLKYIRTFSKKLKTKMVGSCGDDGPIRDKSSKWYVSRQDYKERNYPGHCSGTGYLTSFEMIEKIYDISPYVPFFWIEDIYVSLCFRKVGGTVEKVIGYYRDRPEYHPCFFKGDNLYISHKVTHELMRTIWEAKC